MAVFAALPAKRSASAGLGKEASHKNAKKALETDQHSSESFKGLSSHLSGAVGLNPVMHPIRMGKRLEFDAATDALLARPNRAPYIVPEEA